MIDLVLYLLGGHRLDVFSPFSLCYNLLHSSKMIDLVLYLARAVRLGRFIFGISFFFFNFKKIFFFFCYKKKILPHFLMSFHVYNFSTFDWSAALFRLSVRIIFF